MKIKTRLYLNLAISLSLMTVLLVVMFRFSLSYDDEMTRTTMANELVRDTTELITLTHDYLTLYNERSEKQWGFQLALILKTLEENDDQDRLYPIIYRLKLLDEYFSRLKREHNLKQEMLRNNALEIEIQKIEHAQTILSNQIQVNAQEIQLSMFNLASKTNRKMRAIHKNTIAAILVFMLVLIVVSTINALVAARGIIGPLNRLIKGVSSIEGDNFQYQIPENKKMLPFSKSDEVDTLTEAFNHMTRRLRRTFSALQEEIAEKQKAESALKESEEKYRYLFNTNLIGVGLMDLKGNFLEVNETMCQLTGYDYKVFLNLNLKELLNNSEELGILAENGIENLPESHELKFVKKGEGTLWVNYKLKQITYGNSKSFLITMDDISAKKESEKILERANLELEAQVKERTFELEKAKEAAEQANLLKTEFLANISHELRNPMHQVLTYSRYGINKINKPKEKLMHYFNQTRKAAERLMALLNDLLDLSKMEFGGMDYKMEINNVYQIVQEAVSETLPSIEDKKLTLIVNDPSVSTRLYCDSYKLGQVVRNILANAVKFSSEEKKIEISFSKDDMTIDNITTSSLQVSISDQGVGIPDNELSLVFDKFTQSSKTKTGAGGTGLGLAICHEIIKAHKGDIWAENNPSGGTTFVFQLPYV